MVHNLNNRARKIPILVHERVKVVPSSGWLSKKSPKRLAERFFSEPWFGSCIF